MTDFADEKTPSQKLVRAIIIGVVLAVPIFMTWLLVYDRQRMSEEARQSITQGWGEPQVMSGPVLVIPFRSTIEETSNSGGKQTVVRRDVWKELTLEPQVARIASDVDPQVLNRSIYQAVVYSATARGQATFRLPADLARFGVSPDKLDLTRAELRFGLSDPRGLGANPKVIVSGRPLALQPGAGSGQGSGFFGFVDASGIAASPMVVDFDFTFRGNQSLALAPMAGDTRWLVHGKWGSPSFGGSFLPMRRSVSAKGFAADYPIGNLALGRSLVSVAGQGESRINYSAPQGEIASADNHPEALASIALIQPVDLYSRVDRATKYGFLFIGFTFLALLMFDVIGGARVSGVEYLLTGAALVLFFVMLLAFAEVIGFTAAYILASAAIVGLDTAYSAAVLGSWRRGAMIGGLLTMLYLVLYILLGLEAMSLVIGSLLLFAALAAVMYATRNIDWSGPKEVAA